MNCVTGLLASQSAIRFQLRLSITFHPARRPRDVLQYTCKYNQCNGNRALDKMETLVDQIYNVTSIWESLGYQKQPIIASTLATTSQLSNTLTTNEQVSSATIEDTQKTDIPSITTSTSTSTSKMESEAMSTMEVATMFTLEMETTSMIESETTYTMEIDTTSDIPEPEVHTELSSNPSPVSTAAVVETTTVETTSLIEIDITSNIPEPEVYSDLSSSPFSASTTETATVETTLVDTLTPSLETIPTATTTSDVVTTGEVYLTDTKIIDSRTEPITVNDSGQIRSTDLNIAVIVLVLSYLHLLWRGYWNKIHLRSSQWFTGRESSDCSSQCWSVTIRIDGRAESGTQILRSITTNLLTQILVDILGSFCQTCTLSARERNINSF